MIVKTVDELKRFLDGLPSSARLADPMQLTLVWGVFRGSDGLHYMTWFENKAEAELWVICGRATKCEEVLLIDQVPFRAKEN